MSDKVTKDLIDIFQPNGIDWLGDKISEDNTLTYHHITKACEKGHKTLNNGALLTKRSHKYLHEVLEREDLESYLLLNIEFKRLNMTKLQPTEEYYEKIDDILGDRTRDFRNIKVKSYRRK